MSAPRVLAETQIPTNVEGFSVTVAAIAGDSHAPRVLLTLFLPDEAEPWTPYTLSPAAARRFALALESVIAATAAKYDRATGDSVTAPVHTARLDGAEQVRVGVIHDNGRWFLCAQDDDAVPCLALAPLTSAPALIGALNDMAAVADGKRERLETPM